MRTLAATTLAYAALASLALASGHSLAQAPGGAAPQRSPSPPPRSATVPRPTLSESRKALDASLEEARRMGISVSCAIVDVRGDLVAFVRMDDASFLTGFLAEGKALGSALFGIPSSALGRMAASPFFASVNASVQDRIVPAQGAVPIVREARVIGAIGCSGGAPPQDEATAKAGLAAL
jgi:glc operon protein GlcG